MDAERCEAVVDKTNDETIPELGIEERIDLIVEQIFTPIQLYAADGSSDLDRYARAAAQGLSSTSDMISDIASSTAKMGIWDYFKTAADIGSKLNNIYSGAKAIQSVYKYINDFGKPSEFEQVIQKLEEISETLKRVEAEVKKGFDKFIAHADFAAYRNDVSIPTRILFDKYRSCFVVYGETPITEFKEACGKTYIPKDILSTIYEYLTSKNNVFASQLTADKHAYSTYTTWVHTVFHHAIELITVNLFYYGLVAADGTEKKKEENEEFAKTQMSEFIGQLFRMAERMEELELDRLKEFHSSGDGQEWIKKVFAELPKEKSVDQRSQFINGFLPKLAMRFGEEWMNFNGPTDFYVMLCRGRIEAKSHEYRQAGVFMGDKEKVTVVSNVAYENTSTQLYQDGLILVLIQPFTAEMREANKPSKSTQEALQKIFEKNRDEQYIIASTKEEIFRMRSKKPLLIMYNTDIEHNGSKEAKIPVRVSNFIGEAVGEAALKPYQSRFTDKYYWYDYFKDANNYPITPRRIMQVIFQ